MFQPYDHQTKIAGFIQYRDASLINAEMRTGKTAATLMAVEQLDYSRVLVVCPKPAIDVWGQEVAVHFPQLHDNMLPLCTDQPVKDRVVRIHEWASSDLSAIIVLNYDIIPNKNVQAALKAFKPQMIVLDESHRIKSYKSKVSKILHRLGKDAKKRVCLTGTPFHNSPLDIFGQMRFLDDTVFGTRWQTFQETYAHLYTLPGTRVRVASGHKNLDKLEEKLKPYMYTIRAASVLDMPAEVNSYQRVTFPQEMERIYHELEKDFVADLRKSTIIADHVLTRIIRLRQMAGGDAFDWFDDFKVKALNDILLDYPNEPVVIFAAFTREIQRLSEILDCSVLDGTHREHHDWLDGDTQILVAQISAGAEALNLSRARHIIFYSLGYSLGMYEQARARIKSPRHRRVFYHHLLTGDSIDEIIYDALQAKTDVNNYLLQRMKNEY